MIPLRNDVAWRDDSPDTDGPLRRAFVMRSCAGLLLAAAVTLGGCRCTAERPAASATDAAASSIAAAGAAAPPRAAPATAPAASAPTPAGSPAQAAAVRRQYLAQAAAVVRGQGDLGALWRDLPRYNEALARANGVGPVPLEPLKAAVRRRLEFLYTCRAVQAKDPGICRQAAPLGGALVKACQDRVFLVRTALPEMLVEKRCVAASLARAARSLGMTARQMQAFCRAVTERSPEKCPTESIGGHAICRALATGDANACGAASAGKPRAEQECRSNFLALQALATGDPSRLPPAGDGVITLARSALGAAASCEDRVLADLEPVLNPYAPPR